METDAKSANLGSLSKTHFGDRPKADYLAGLKFSKSSSTWVSASFKLPVMETPGPVIGVRITGALSTRPRQTMASRRPMLVVVMVAKLRDASSFSSTLISFLSVWLVARRALATAELVWVVRRRLLSGHHLAIEMESELDRKSETRRAV